MSSKINQIRAPQNPLPTESGLNRLRLVENDSRYDIFAQKIQSQSLLQRVISWYYNDVKVIVNNTPYHVRVKSVTKRVGVTPDVVLAITKKDNAAEILKAFTNLKKTFEESSKKHLKIAGTRYFQYADQFYKGEKIGSGTYGKVYKVQNVITGTTFAAKKARSKDTEKKPSLAAHNDLNNEYSILAHIHAGGTKVGIQKAPHKENETTPFYVTELYAGDLKKINSDLIKQPVSERLLLCRQLLQGLKTLHELQFVHGDIKPANCLMKKDDKGKITEFAISDLGGAKKIMEDGELNDNRIITTPSYLPADLTEPNTVPEMVQNADVYAMSKTIIETLSGRFIEQRSNDNELIRGDLEAAVAELKKQRIPLDVIKVLTSGIAKVASRPSAEQLLNNYDEALRAAKIAIPD